VGKWEGKPGSTELVSKYLLCFKIEGQVVKSPVCWQ